MIIVRRWLVLFLIGCVSDRHFTILLYLCVLMKYFWNIQMIICCMHWFAVYCFFPLENILQNFFHATTKRFLSFFLSGILHLSANTYSWLFFYWWTFGCSQFFVIKNNTRVEICLNLLGMNMSVFLYNNHYYWVISYKCFIFS